MTGKKEQKILDLIQFVKRHNKLPQKGQMFGETNVYQLLMSIQYRKTYRKFWEKIGEHPLLYEIVSKFCIPESKQPEFCIDSLSRKNIFESTEYVGELYEEYRKKELSTKISLNFLKNNVSEINHDMRSIVINFLITIHWKCRCVPETLFLSVNIFDRYLDAKPVRKTKLFCVGLTAFFIASKYEEIRPQRIHNLQCITRNSYTKKEILTMENNILSTLQYKVTVVTPHAFLVRFLKATLSNNRTTYFASYLLERTLQEKFYNTYSPSMLAASSVLIARETIQKRSWTPTLEYYTGYTERALNDCKTKMIFMANIKNPRLNIVKNKYKLNKFLAVATINI
jgi:hypothetical protein